MRLEKRYAKRTHRSGYHNNAEYVDGEYIVKPTTAPQIPNRKGLGKKVSEHNIKVRAVNASGRL